MVKNKAALLAILMLVPLLSFAHGEEAVYTLFMEAVSILMFIVVILALNLSKRGKGVLAIIYILTTSTLLFAVNQLPYRQYMNLISWSLVLVPATVLALSYLYLKASYQKKK